MRCFLFLTVGLAITACQPATSAPQNFDDLLRITDETNIPICTLPLKDMREKLNAEEIDAREAIAFDFDSVVSEYSDDPIAQTRVIHRRAALKRRLNVDGDETELADKFYQSLDDGDDVPRTLKGFHDRMHYWVDRIAEQGQHGEPDSAEFNLRFCVINEKRADLHAASRADILARMEAGVTFPNHDLIENINHETFYGDAFRADILERIYSSESISQMSPLDIGKMRGRNAILPFESKQADSFWEARDEEIAAVLEYIKTHDFKTFAEKLTQMTAIDQSLRKLWGPETESHFENAEELETFKAGVWERATKVDEFNTAELQKMLEGRGWFRDDVDGKGAAGDAWLIAQHADRNPDFQIKALKLIKAEFGAPGVSKSSYAYLYDRVQISWGAADEMDKRVQRYATQGRCSGPGAWEPFPVEEPDRIDEIRAEVGLGTLADYKSRFKDICQEDQR